MSLATLHDSAMNAKLWQAFQAGSQEARDRLLEDHLGLVHHVARQVSRTLAVRADVDELVSAGTIGLMAALESFDASRGLAFSTFAAPRIRGALLDELRKQDHVPRSVRRKTRELSAAREAFQRAHGRAPEDRELAEQMGVDLETVWRWKADIEGATQLPIDRQPGDKEQGTAAPVDYLADETDHDVEASLTHEQEVRYLRDALLRLKEQERVVLSLYFFEELKLHEIAKVLELTESRVSQIRTKALSKLRTDLRPLREGIA